MQRGRDASGITPKVPGPCTSVLLSFIRGREVETRTEGEERLPVSRCRLLREKTCREMPGDIPDPPPTCTVGELSGGQTSPWDGAKGPCRAASFQLLPTSSARGAPGGERAPSSWSGQRAAGVLPAKPGDNLFSASVLSFCPQPRDRPRSSGLPPAANGHETQALASPLAQGKDSRRGHGVDTRPSDAAELFIDAGSEALGASARELAPGLWATPASAWEVLGGSFRTPRRERFNILHSGRR